MRNEEKSMLEYMQLKYIRAFERLAEKYKKDIGIPMSKELVHRITTNLRITGK